jgi:hypothetical protein
VWLFTVNCRLLTCALRNEQVGDDVEEGCQLLRMGFANRTLAAEYLGGNSFGAEDSPEVLLRQITSLHQEPKVLLRTRLANHIAALFLFVNEDS